MRGIGVARLLKNLKADWYIKAPEVSKGSGLISSFLPTKDLYYFAYGGDMFSKTLLKKTELVNIRFTQD